ncbi:MAG: phytoene desaturase family protein, partial [Candidatus Paceibacteria bacterium]
MANIVIIGGGIGGLASACILGYHGHDVYLYEKNSQLGGRANQFSSKGFTFDMGPSWYLMPDVFENFFSLVGERVEDHLTLQKLAPSYRIFFKEDGTQVDMYSDLERDIPTLEALESGAGEQLRTYLQNAKTQYDIAKSGFMYKNYDAIWDFVNLKTM